MNNANTINRREELEAKYAAARNRDNANAVALYPVLLAVNACDVPLMSTDRHMPRKEQAAMARELFKHLGLRGISVKTPNYSMASTVDVQLPKLSRHDETAWPHHHGDCCTSGHTEASQCRTCRIQNQAKAKVAEILNAAFPKHDDRSDSQSDYFDFCWSID